MKPAPAARAALDRLLRLPEPEIPLAEAALLIAQEEYPELDVRAYLARLTALGHQLAKALATYSQTEGTGPGGTWTRSGGGRNLNLFSTKNNKTAYTGAFSEARLDLVSGSISFAYVR